MEFLFGFAAGMVVTAVAGFFLLKWVASPDGEPRGAAERLRALTPKQR